MPKRIQRKRTKGWKAPEGAVAVTRGTKWGNPFKVGGWFKMGNGLSRFSWLRCLVDDPEERKGFTLIENAKMAVDWHAHYLIIYPPKESDLAEIRGHDLMCFCALDQPCHADILLEIANSWGGTDEGTKQ